jgi:hypothetical protein
LKLYLYICKRSQQQLYNCIDTTGSRNCTATIQTIRKFWIANSHTKKQPIRNRYDLSPYSFLQTSETNSRIQRGGKAWSELKEWDSSLFKHFIKQLLCMFELTAKFQTTKHQCSIKSHCNLCVHLSDCITCRLIVNDIQHESFWISPPQPASLEKEWKERKEKKEKKKKKTSFLFSDFVSTGYSFFIHFYKNHNMKGKNEKTKTKRNRKKKTFV